VPIDAHEGKPHKCSRYGIYFRETIEKAKQEAVDNFAEKVKKKIHRSEEITHTAPPRIPVCVVVRIIDNTLKQQKRDEP